MVAVVVDEPVGRLPYGDDVFRALRLFHIIPLMPMTAR